MSSVTRMAAPRKHPGVTRQAFRKAPAHCSSWDTDQYVDDIEQPCSQCLSPEAELGEHKQALNLSGLPLDILQRAKWHAANDADAGVEAGRDDQALGVGKGPSIPGTQAGASTNDVRTPGSS